MKNPAPNYQTQLTPAADLSVIKELLEKKDLSTAPIYEHVSEKKLRELHAKAKKGKKSP